MPNRRWATLYAAAFALLFAADAAAIGCNVFRTINLTRHKVWFTMQDLGKTRNLDYGWVEACSYRDWRSGGYGCGGVYFSRAEVKNYAVTQNVFDTRMQTSMNVTGGGGPIVALHKSGEDKFYLEESRTKAFPCDGNGKCTCEGTYPADAPRVDVRLTNSLTSAVQFSLDSDTGQPIQRGCLEAKQVQTWKFGPATAYTMRASRLPGPCSANPPPGVAIAQVSIPVRNGAANATIRELVSIVPD